MIKHKFCALQMQLLANAGIEQYTQKTNKFEN